MRISDWSSDVCSSDLHALITLQPGSPINDWHFFVDGHETMIRARGTICTNHGDSILALALSGAGLAMLAAHVVGEHLKSGRLVSVLADHVRAAVPISAVYPSNQSGSASVRERGGKDVVNIGGA